MRRSAYIILLALAAAAPSCASIVSGSNYSDVEFNSDPQGAELTVENRDGYVVFSGHTPSTVYLAAAAGYMRPERYKVTYRHDGDRPVTTHINARINGWYFGNLFMGGLIGMLLVDPVTGAMFRIPPHAEVITVPPGPPYRVPETPSAAGEWNTLGE